MKISVTYRISVIDLGYDEEDEEDEEDEKFCCMTYEDNYFVITGLPTEHASAFWEKIAEIHGCSQRLAKKDHRLRVDWDNRDHELTKGAIVEAIKSLVPDAEVRYRQLGSGLYEPGDYTDNDRMLLGGAFTDEERTYLPVDERAAILGIRPS